jgi:hypothetical protein
MDYSSHLEAHLMMEHSCLEAAKSYLMVSFVNLLTFTSTMALLIVEKVFNQMTSIVIKEVVDFKGFSSYVLKVALDRLNLASITKFSFSVTQEA